MQYICYFFGFVLVFSGVIAIRLGHRIGEITFQSLSSLVGGCAFLLCGIIFVVCGIVINEIRQIKKEE